MKKTVIIYLALVLNAIATNAQVAGDGKIIYIKDNGENFSSLIDKYKGQIIYIDVWATWCLPCRQELLKQKAKAFRNFAKRNNIVMLYLCCDKDEFTWKKFVAANHLSGYHFFMNEPIRRDFHSI